MKTQTFNQVQVWYGQSKSFPLLILQLTTQETSLLSDTCKVNIWNYTWRFHMLILVICASIKIRKYNEAFSYGYVRTRIGKGGRKQNK